MTLNILSIDEGEEWFEPCEPPVPVYWVNTQFEQFMSDNWNFGMLNRLVRHTMADFDNHNSFFAEAGKIGDTLSIRVPEWQS
jgi:hypothetical protein